MAAIVERQPEQSALLRRITATDDTIMPPAEHAKPLTPPEIETIARWIAEGAKYSRHWAYEKPTRPELPTVSDPAWPINPIDRFILARLDVEKLRPSPPADKAILLRRVSLDLVGLPPTVEEVDAFLRDTRPDAYERAVEQLLAKPGYGERWAAVWLDLARYGDSQGYTHDPPRTIWRWRDWLIEALNQNLPYDRFTEETLAGDLLENPTVSQVIATGFHRNTPSNTEGGANAEEYRHAAVVDRVNTTMQVWMGTTMACAQCHNHKYDPFSQKEYYQLFAIFNATEDFNAEPPIQEVPRIGKEQEYTEAKRLVEAATAELQKITEVVDAQQASWESSVDQSPLPPEIKEILILAADKRSKEQQDKLAAHHRSLKPEWMAAQAALSKLQASFAEVSTTTLIMKEIAPRPTFVALRGEFRSPGEAVTPGVPASLHAAPEGMALNRLGFARWLMSPENPLTARVAVNRLWQEVFGIGLVETSEEFGNQGDAPSHPELLDWLATEYMAQGWDTKRLLTLLVTSATYRQSSRVTEYLADRDPKNRLYASGPRARLGAETIRDQALFVGGLLSPKMYGPPVRPMQPQNGLAAAFGTSTDWETSKGEDAYRRAVYTMWRRNLPYPSILAFDAPERSVCSVRRIRTNTPLQALVTLNDPVYVEAAQGLARRILREGGATVATRAHRGFRLVLLRHPEQAELDRLVTLYEEARSALAVDATKATLLATKPIGPIPEGADVVEPAAWTVVSNVLLNLDETLAKP